MTDHEIEKKEDAPVEEAPEIRFEVIQDLDDDKLMDLGYRKYPLADTESVSSVLEQLKKLADSKGVPGGEGIYRVTFPKDVNGTLCAFKDKSGFTGTVMDNGPHQVIHERVQYDPADLMLSLQLASINMKLNDIQKDIAGIQQFLKDDKETLISSELHQLNEYAERLSANKNNDLFMEEVNHLLADAAIDSDHQIEFSRKQINEKLASMTPFHTVKDAVKLRNEIYREFIVYRNSLVLREYGKYMECIVHENMSAENLAAISKQLSTYLDAYNSMLTDASRKVQAYIEKSWDYLLTDMRHAGNTLFAEILPGETLKEFCHDDIATYLPADVQIKEIQQLTSNKSTDEFYQNILCLDAVYRSGQIYLNKEAVFMPLQKENVAQKSMAMEQPLEEADNSPND